MNAGEARKNLIACENRCLRKCEKKIYSRLDIHEGDIRSIVTNTKGKLFATIKLVIASYDYPIFEEIWEMSFPQFFGALGGALGLWLGITVLDTIIYVTKGIKILIKARQRKIADEKLARKSCTRVKNDNINEDERTSKSKRHR